MADETPHETVDQDSGGVPPAGSAGAGAGGGIGAGGPGPASGDGVSPEPDRPEGGGQIVDLDIERELKDSYLTYAMSTIVDRALPDVRDGLKPSQRRILVAMNDLRLRPGRKHLKCAKICGDTSGNYHPHGEAVIYPTLVGMAQSWKMRVPLIDPQGNFGSILGDAAAAMRYTEARMAAAAVDLLADLEFETVDLQRNYDDRMDEPTVLPGKFPNLLINGGMGIAVGMATSLPPHNPAEILDAIMRVVERPSITTLELMADEKDADGNVVRLGVKGPDFPTGGQILGRSGILEAYETGRGRVTVRGTCHVEDLKNGRQQIVIDEIPFGVVQRPLVEKIVEAVKEGRLVDISDVRDESGRLAQSRVVIELKKGADAAVVENQLYSHTPLQQTFSIINIALVNRQPRTMGLRDLLRAYVEHRVVVIRRRTEHLLREAKKRAHILEGMIYAVTDIDEVVRLIRSSRTREQAIERLMERRYRVAEDHPAYMMLPDRLRLRLARAEAAGGVALTRVQAEAIGAMRLIQLTGLEIERLTNDYRQVVERIEDYEDILSSPARVNAMIREDCEEMKSRYGTGPAAQRRTEILDVEGDIDIASLIQVEDMAVTISHQGYVKRVPASTYSAQGRGGKGIRAGEMKDDDFIERVIVASTHDDLLCFTDSGRVFKLKVYELPELGRTSKGRAIQNFIEKRPEERTRAYLAIRDFEAGSDFLTFVSRSGVVKRTALKDYRNVNRSGLIAVGLREGDELLDVMLTRGDDDILLVTAEGMAIRFSEQDARLMGRQAAGVKGIDLSGDNRVVGTVAIPMVPGPGGPEGERVTAPAAIERNLCLLTITANGYGKRTPVDEYRVRSEAEDGSFTMRSQSRGGKGRADIKVTSKNGPAVAAMAVETGDDVVVITRQGQLVRTAADEIRQTGRGAQGVRVVSLRGGDEVVAAARVLESEVVEE